MRCTRHGRDANSQFIVLVKPTREERPAKRTHIRTDNINMEMKSVGVMVRTELNCELDFNINGHHFLCCSHIVRLYHELRSVEIISKYRFLCTHVSHSTQQKHLSLQAYILCYRFIAKLPRILYTLYVISVYSNSIHFFLPNTEPVIHV